MRTGIIGGGRAAYAFARSFARVGWNVEGVYLRAGSPSRISDELSLPRLGLAPLLANCDLVLLAVTDSALAELAQDCARNAPSETFLMHASGAESSELFRRPRSFALHPLRALRADDDLAGTFFVFDGDAGSEALARELAGGLGGTLSTIAPAMKAKYHAAAVFASNFVAVVLETSERLMREAGVEMEPRHLAALARSAVANWEQGIGAGRFTGPIARGDAAVVARHLEALGGDDHATALYRELSRNLVAQLLAAAPDRSDLKEIARRLDDLHVS